MEELAGIEEPPSSGSPRASAARVSTNLLSQITEEEAK